MTEMHLAVVRQCDEVGRRVEAVAGELRGTVKSTYESLAGNIRELGMASEERLYRVENNLKDVGLEGGKVGV